MATVVDSYPSDSPGYTHYVLARPYTGIIEATVSGLVYDYISPPNPDGTFDFQKGDPVNLITVGLDAQRDFEIPGEVSMINFVVDDTTYTPKA